MKLHSPFIISARLAPAVTVGGATISFDRGRFIIDIPDGAEYVVTNFHFPAVRLRGETDGDRLADGFAAILTFLSACAESRAYARRTGREGENAGLFPENVGQWAEDYSDLIDMLRLEIEESEVSLIED